MTHRKWSSVYNRLIPLAVLLGVALCTVLLLLGALAYRDTMETHYVVLGRRLARTVANFMDGDSVERYLDTLTPDAEYRATHGALRAVTECDEVAYAYVVRMHAGGMRYVYDSDAGDTYALGSEVAYAGSRLAPAAPPAAATLGQPPAAGGAQGRLLSVFEPIYNGQGRLAGYVGIDMAMGTLDADCAGFVLVLLALVLVATATVLGTALLLLRRGLVRPLNAMVRAADDFLSGAPRGGAAVSSIEALDIRTGDELERLAGALKAMEKRTRQYIDSLSTATREAETDMLTGLYNRAAFERKVTLLLRDSADAEAVHAFFILDVDRFKQVNDRFGHMAGDELLKACAGVLGRVFRSADLVARLGGDEFTVFCPGAGSAEVVELKAAQVCEAWRGIVLPDGQPLSTSVGVAMSPRDGRTYDALYRSADAALYAAKHAGRGCFVICGDRRPAAS